MFETNDELKNIKEENNTINEKSKELSDDLLKKVSGGDFEYTDIELQNIIIGIISEKLDLNHVTLLPSSRLFVDFELDELDVIDIIQALEFRFKIDIDKRVFSSFPTIANIVGYISCKVNPKRY